MSKDAKASDAEAGEKVAPPSQPEKAVETEVKEEKHKKDTEEVKTDEKKERDPVVKEGKREKKKVERLSFQAPKSKAETHKIEEGTGERLGEIERVNFFMNKMKADILKPLHKVIYNRPGNLTEVKKNIRQFNGFSFSKDSDIYKRKEDSIKKYHKDVLKASFCDVLDLEKGGNKDEVVARIMEFLLQPKSSGKSLPKSSHKRKSSGRGSRASHSKKTPGSAGGKKKRKVVKKDDEEVPSDSNSSNDEEEEEEEEEEEKEEGDAESSKDEEEEDEAGEGDGDDEDEEKESSKGKSPKQKSQTKRKRADLKAYVKKADSSTNKKAAAPQPKKKPDWSDSSDDEPLIKKTKRPPSDDDLRQAVRLLLDGADLESVTMKHVCKEVYAKFPDFDLTERKDLIKQAVKEVRDANTEPIFRLV
ncbi:unnamed protein product [Lampetra planeri]